MFTLKYITCSNLIFNYFFLMYSPWETACVIILHFLIFVLFTKYVFFYSKLNILFLKSYIKLLLSVLKKMLFYAGPVKKQVTLLINNCRLFNSIVNYGEPIYPSNREVLLLRIKDKVLRSDFSNTEQTFLSFFTR